MTSKAATPEEAPLEDALVKRQNVKVCDASVEEGFMVADVRSHAARVDAEIAITSASVHQ